MNIRFFRRRSVRLGQGRFAFMERAISRDRLFKRAIILATCLVIVVIIRAFPWGRYLVASIEPSTKRVAHLAMGLSARAAAEINEGVAELPPAGYRDDPAARREILRRERSGVIRS